jgi:hypothetical protein
LMTSAPSRMVWRTAWPTLSVPSTMEAIAEAPHRHWDGRLCTSSERAVAGRPFASS